MFRKIEHGIRKKEQTTESANKRIETFLDNGIGTEKSGSGWGRLYQEREICESRKLAACPFAYNISRRRHTQGEGERRKETCTLIDCHSM